MTVAEQTQRQRSAEQATRDLLARVRRLEIRTRRRVGERLSGRYQSAFRGRGLEFEEVRPYQFGDDVRAIDWNVSARYERPYVKLFREERELSVILLADLSASLDFGTEQLKGSLLVEAAATLAFSAVMNNDRVGLVGFTDRIELHLPVRRGRRHGLRIIRDLLAARPAGRRTDIAAALDHLNRVQRRPAVVFLLSDFLSDGFEKPMRLAASRFDLVAVALTDPAELALPSCGLVRLRDPETGAARVVDTGSGRVRRAFQERVQAMLERRSSLLNAHAGGVIWLNTSQPLDDPLRRFFEHRERSRGRGSPGRHPLAPRQGPSLGGEPP